MTKPCRYIESSVVAVVIHCGACEKDVTCKGSMDIETRGCDCGPEDGTCMCEPGATLNFKCPECSYTGRITL